MRAFFHLLAQRYERAILASEFFFERHWKLHKWLIIFITSLLIVIWDAPYIYSGGLIDKFPGDSDYFFQAYEAARKAILDYHQFPWWNPWVSGGVPLFANPQIGVISPQMLLVLIFGTVFGLKLSIIAYTLAGFWGAYLLLRSKLQSNVMVSLLLAFCWIMNGFFIAHLFNHYTFIYFILIPLGIYLLLNITRRRYWLYFALYLSVMILGSFHYALLQGIVVFSFVCILQMIGLLIEGQSIKASLIAITKALGVVLIICGVRIFYTFQYVFDFPKAYPNDEVNPIIMLLKGLLTPGNGSNVINGSLLQGGEYGVGEYSAYIGIATAVGLIIIVVSLVVTFIHRFRAKRQLVITTPEIIQVGLFLLIPIVLLIAKGVWDELSPLGIITSLPGYDNMRVPSRWLIWVGLIAVVIIASFIAIRSKHDRLRLVLVGFVIISFIELFLVGFWSARTQFTRQPILFRNSNEVFVQYEDYDPSINDDSKLYQVTRKPRGRDTTNYEYEATINNIGELYGYEPLYYKSLFNTVGRCGINYGCGLLVSKNARVIKWSPNEIVIKRNASGPIVLNINPSAYWKLNGKRLFPTGKVIEEGQLVLYDSAVDLTLSIQPQINPKTVIPD